MNLSDAAARYCTGYDLPLTLLMAMGEISTGLEMTATDYDPLYQWFWDCDQRGRYTRRVLEDEAAIGIAPTDFPVPEGCGSRDTEWIGQHMSWGPFLVNGAALRACGYHGPFTAMCSDPDLAARFASVHMARMHSKYFKRHGWAGVVSAFHAGRPRKDEKGVYSNVEYLKKVSKIKGASKFMAFVGGG